MLKTVLIACLLATSLTWSILKKADSTPALTTQEGDNLKFGTFIGPGVSDAQGRVFAKAVVDASSVWGGDVAKNLEFITNYMNSYGGSPGDEYFVFIQTKAIYFGWSVWSYGSDVATYAGVNPLYPSWSYMFLKGGINKSNPPYSVVEDIATGSGVDASTESFIKDVLTSEDTGDFCACNVNGIENRLVSYDGQMWSVICDDAKDVHARLEPNNQQWIYAKGNNCYYFLWVI
jgi:hypothetical protein